MTHRKNNHPASHHRRQHQCSIDDGSKRQQQSNDPMTNMIVNLVIAVILTLIMTAGYSRAMRPREFSRRRYGPDTRLMSQEEFQAQRADFSNGQIPKVAGISFLIAIGLVSTGTHSFLLRKTGLLS